MLSIPVTVFEPSVIGMQLSPPGSIDLFGRILTGGGIHNFIFDLDSKKLWAGKTQGAPVGASGKTRQPRFRELIYNRGMPWRLIRSGGGSTLSNDLLEIWASGVGFTPSRQYAEITARIRGLRIRPKDPVYDTNQVVSAVPKEKCVFNP